MTSNLPNRGLCRSRTQTAAHGDKASALAATTGQVCGGNQVRTELGLETHRLRGETRSAGAVSTGAAASILRLLSREVAVLTTGCL